MRYTIRYKDQEWRGTVEEIVKWSHCVERSFSRRRKAAIRWLSKQSMENVMMGLV
jgi:hypothetical protein